MVRAVLTAIFLTLFAVISQGSQVFAPSVDPIGADADLGNLSTTSINKNLLGNTGAAWLIQSINVASGTTKAMTVQSGNTDAVGSSGNASLYSGYSTAANTGWAAVISGDAINGNTGDAYLGAGSAKNNPGDVYIYGGPSVTQTGGDVFVTPGAGTSTGKIYFQGSSEGTAGYFWVSKDTSGGGGWTAPLTIANGHLTATQTTKPTILIAAGAGTGASASVANSSSDVAGQFTITSGSIGTPGTGTQATLSYNVACTNGSFAVITPKDSNAAVAEATLGIYAAPTASGFAIGTVIALGTSTAYVWNYHATCY